MNTQIKTIFAALLMATITGCSMPSPSTSEESKNTTPEAEPVNLKAEVKAEMQEQANKEQPRDVNPDPYLDPDFPGGLPAGTDIVIRAGDERTIREYRVNGQLYAIKVVPKVGKPYYLIAEDSKGEPLHFDDTKMLIPSWKVLEW